MNTLAIKPILVPLAVAAPRGKPCPHFSFNLSKLLAELNEALVA